MSCASKCRAMSCLPGVCSIPCTAHAAVCLLRAVLNDSYRTDAVLLYPPYVIAIGCINVVRILHSNLVLSGWFTVTVKHATLLAAATNAYDVLKNWLTGSTMVAHCSGSRPHAEGSTRMARAHGDRSESGSGET